MFQTTCLDFWRKETLRPNIITFCKSLDKYLGNGIAPGIITEFSGRPGSGKTQMCMQLCLTVQFRDKYKAIFIDTNQGFNPFRLKEMATFCAKRIEEINPNLTIDKFLENITYIYCDEYVVLLAKLEQIIQKIEKDPLIKLIVVDSFSYLFRTFASTGERISITFQLLSKLQCVAEKYNIVVVITNELTTRITGTNESEICASLGDSHSHMVGQRIILTKYLGGTRYAYIDKSIHCTKVAIPFEIRDCGIGSVNAVVNGGVENETENILKGKNILKTL